jgi:hypothetical protein
LTPFLDGRATHKAAVELQKIPGNPQEADLKGSQKLRIVVRNQQGKGIAEQEVDLLTWLRVLDRCACQFHQVRATAEPSQLFLERGKRLNDRELIDRV